MKTSDSTTAGYLAFLQSTHVNYTCYFYLTLGAIQQHFPYNVSSMPKQSIGLGAEFRGRKGREKGRSGKGRKRRKTYFRIIGILRNCRLYPCRIYLFLYTHPYVVPYQHIRGSFINMPVTLQSITMPLFWSGDIKMQSSN